MGLNAFSGFTATVLKRNIDMIYTKNFKIWLFGIALRVICMV